MKFDIDENSEPYWHSNSAWISHFFTAFSNTFPEGERTFIESVKFFEHQIRDPELQDRVDAFVRQEAQHSIQHRLYNNAIFGSDLGPVFAEKEKKARAYHEVLNKQFSDLDRLASTAAYEHITAVFADKMLRYDNLSADMDARIRPLWLWHSLEEIEHKSVAFDVYQSVGGYERHRRKWFFNAMLLLPFILTWTQVELLIHDHRLFDVRDFFRYLRYMFGKRGLARLMLPDLLRYARHGFHPWQLDNHDLIERWRAEVDSYMVQRA